MNPIDLEASGSYSLLLKDIDKDGNADIVLLAYAGTTDGNPPGEVYWYRWSGLNSNKKPVWTKYLLSKRQHVVHGSFIDVDGDGYDDLVFNSDFEVPPEDIEPQGDYWCAINPGPGHYDQAWDTSYIGRVVGNHRTATGDFDGDGLKEAVAIPLFSPGEEPYYGPATIVIFEPPQPWTPNKAWTSTNLSWDFFLNPHDVVVVPEEDKDALMLASHQGLHRMDISRDENYKFISHLVELHSYPEDDPKDAEARDVGFKPLPQNCDANPTDLHGVTALTKNVRNIKSLPYLATIDYTNTSGILPGQVWHGDQVSVYFPAPGKTVADGGLTRQVLEKRYSGGHTVVVHDFDNDGCADIVAGFREYPTSMMLYRCVKNETNIGGVSFRKQIISERGTNDIVIDDFDKDGFMDVATVGFGGMSGEGGDPYVLMWFYRGANSISMVTNVNKNNSDDEHYSKPIVIALIIATCLLGVALLLVLVYVYIPNRQRKKDFSELSMRADMERSLLS